MLTQVTLNAIQATYAAFLCVFCFLCLWKRKKNKIARTLNMPFRHITRIQLTFHFFVAHSISFAISAWLYFNFSVAYHYLSLPPIGIQAKMKTPLFTTIKQSKCSIFSAAHLHFSLPLCCAVRAFDLCVLSVDIHGNKTDNEQHYAEHKRMKDEKISIKKKKLNEKA